VAAQHQQRRHQQPLWSSQPFTWSVPQWRNRLHLAVVHPRRLSGSGHHLSLASKAVPPAAEALKVPRSPAGMSLSCFQHHVEFNLGLCPHYAWWQLVDACTEADLHCCSRSAAARGRQAGAAEGGAAEPDAAGSGTTSAFRGVSRHRSGPDEDDMSGKTNKLHVGLRTHARLLGSNTLVNVLSR
jgi:hypothetical protein